MKVYLFYAILLLVVGFYGYKHPKYNWDILPYMYLVTSVSNDLTQTERIVFSSAEEQFPKWRFEELKKAGPLTNKHPYLRALPLYTIKPLYLFIVFLLVKLGLSLTHATVLPGLCCYLLIGILLFHWMNKYLKTSVSFSLSLLVMSWDLFVMMVQYSTPDALATLFLFYAFYSIIENKAYTNLALILAILSRIDCALPALILTLLYRRNISNFLSIVVVYLLVSFSSYFVGTPANFFSNYIDRFNPQIKRSPFDFAVYITMLRNALVNSIFNSHLSRFLILSILIRNKMMLVILGLVLARLLLHPSVSDRFYWAYYLTVLMFIIKETALKYRLKS